MVRRPDPATLRTSPCNRKRRLPGGRHHHPRAASGAAAAQPSRSAWTTWGLLAATYVVVADKAYDHDYLPDDFAKRLAAARAARQRRTCGTWWWVRPGRRR